MQKIYWQNSIGAFKNLFEILFEEVNELLARLNFQWHENRNLKNCKTINMTKLTRKILDLFVLRFNCLTNSVFDLLLHKNAQPLSGCFSLV